jgi:hypothetical protein
MSVTLLLGRSSLRSPLEWAPRPEHDLWCVRANRPFSDAVMAVGQVGSPVSPLLPLHAGGGAAFSPITDCLGTRVFAV